MRLLDFTVWFIWRACWLSGVFPGSFYWTVWIGIWSWWGNLWRWGAEKASRKGGLMEILESWFSSHITQFLRWHAFMFSNVLMSRCYWGQASEIWPGDFFNWGWDREPDSTEGGDCEETFGSYFQQPWLPRKIPFVPVLIGAAPCWGGLLMRVMLWLLCRDFQVGSSFHPHCTSFSCYGPVYCRSCFYEHKCHQAPARV